MKNSQLIKHLKNEVQRAELRLSRREKEYQDIIRAKFRFYLKYGFFNDELRTKEEQAYLQVAMAYCEYAQIEQRYYLVKGVATNGNN